MTNRRIRYGTAKRWQAPQTPTPNRTPVVANTFGANCPQSFSQTGATTFAAGNEDCLYLSVYAPSGPITTASNFSPGQEKSGLPVLVWIHGGGYGLGFGAQDMSSFINANDNGLIAVVIQYRVSISAIGEIGIFIELRITSSWAPLASSPPPRSNLRDC